MGRASAKKYQKSSAVEYKLEQMKCLAYKADKLILTV